MGVTRKPRKEFEVTCSCCPVIVKRNRIRSGVVRCTECRKKHDNVNIRHFKRYNEFTQEVYDALLVAQGHRCGICPITEEEYKLQGYRRFSVDHDHSTGQVRGLLCNPCNWGLGQFQDSTGRLSSAIKYLSETPMSLVRKN